MFVARTGCRDATPDRRLGAGAGRGQQCGGCRGAAGARLTTRVRVAAPRSGPAGGPAALAGTAALGPARAAALPRRHPLLPPQSAPTHTPMLRETYAPPQPLSRVTRQRLTSRGAVTPTTFENLAMQQQEAEMGGANDKGPACEGGPSAPPRLERGPWGKCRQSTFEGGGSVPSCG